MRKDKKNEYQYLMIPENIVCFHRTDVYEKGKEYRPYHRHDAYEIYFFVQGNVDFFIEQYCYHLMPGDLIIINTAENHRMICRDNSVYERYVINIKPIVAEKMSTGITNLNACFQVNPQHRNIIALSKEQQEIFLGLYEELYSCMTKEEYGKDILLNACISKILVFINKMFQRSKDSSTDIMPPLIKSVMEYVQEHLLEEITLKDLGGALYMNGSYVSQRFKHFTGMTLREYIIDQRIVLAKTYLLQGKSVSEACELSGFRDYSNFIRTFTQSTGISPGKYQKRTRYDNIENENSLI